MCAPAARVRRSNRRSPDSVRFDFTSKARWQPGQIRKPGAAGHTRHENLDSWSTKQPADCSTSPQFSLRRQCVTTVGPTSDRTQHPPCILHLLARVAHLILTRSSISTYITMVEITCSSEHGSQNSTPPLSYDINVIEPTLLLNLIYAKLAMKLGAHMLFYP
jgi:hypothetical protein